MSFISLGSKVVEKIKRRSKVKVTKSKVCVLIRRCCHKAVKYIKLYLIPSPVLTKVKVLKNKGQMFMVKVNIMVPTDHDIHFSRTFQGLLMYIFKDFSRTFLCSFKHPLAKK